MPSQYYSNWPYAWCYACQWMRMAGQCSGRFSEPQQKLLLKSCSSVLQRRARPESLQFPTHCILATGFLVIQNDPVITHWVPCRWVCMGAGGRGGRTDQGQRSTHWERRLPALCIDKKSCLSWMLSRRGRVGGGMRFLYQKALTYGINTLNDGWSSHAQLYPRLICVFRWAYSTPKCLIYFSWL